MTRINQFSRHIASPSLARFANHRLALVGTPLPAHDLLPLHDSSLITLRRYITFGIWPCSTSRHGRLLHIDEVHLCCLRRTQLIDTESLNELLQTNKGICAAHRFLVEECVNVQVEEGIS